MVHFLTLIYILPKHWKEAPEGHLRVFTYSNEQTVEKIVLLTVARWQKKSIYNTRFAVTEGTVDPHAAYGLCFPQTGDVAVLLLQEKTVFRYCE